MTADLPSSGSSAPAARGPSAAAYVKLDWDYPVYEEVAADTEGSQAKKVRRALTREDAFAYIAGNDPRPLLILRECKVCNGTDTALLRGGVDNERTALLARWFHCVKLPIDVREENHPFYVLFPEKDAEHLFVSSADGSTRIGLESEGSRTRLLDSMGKVIAAEYKQKPASSLKKIAMLLDDLDVLDSRHRTLQLRRNELIEDEGPDSRKLAKIERDLAEVQEELAEARDEVVAASALELKRQKEDRRAREG